MFEKLLVHRVPLLFDQLDGGEGRGGARSDQLLAGAGEHREDQQSARGEEVRGFVEDLENPPCAVGTGRARHPGRVPAREPIEGLGHASDIVNDQVEALPAPGVEQTTRAAGLRRTPQTPAPAGNNFASTTATIPVPQPRSSTECPPCLASALRAACSRRTVVDVGGNTSGAVATAITSVSPSLLSW